MSKRFKLLTIKDLRTGYVMAWKGMGDKFGNLIENHQRSEGLPPEAAAYTHLDILGRREYVVQIMPPKIKTVKLLDAYPSGRECVMLKYTAPDFEIKRRDVAWWAASLNNRKYDILGVIRFKIPFFWHEKDGFFCSEGMLWSFRQEYPRILEGRDPHTFMPGEVFTTPEFEEVGRYIVP